MARIRCSLHLVLACLLLECMCNPTPQSAEEREWAQQHQRRNSEKIRELVRTAAEQKPATTVSKPTAAQPEAVAQPKPATGQERPSAEQHEAAPGKPKPPTLPTKPTATQPTASQSKPASKPKPAAPESKPASKPKPAAPESKPVSKPKPAAPESKPASKPKPAAQESKPAAPRQGTTKTPQLERFREASELLLAAATQLQTRLSQMSTHELQWCLGLGALWAYQGAPSAAAVVLLGVTAGPVLIEQDSVARATAWFSQAEEHLVAQTCVFGAIGLVLLGCYLESLSTWLLLASCSWRVAALLSRLAASALGVPSGPLLQPLVHHSTLELLQGTLDQRTTLLLGLLACLVGLWTRERLLQMLPRTGASGLLARLMSTLVVLAAGTVGKHRWSRTAVSLDGVGPAVALWVSLDALHALCSRVCAPSGRSSGSALPLRVLLSAAGASGFWCVGLRLVRAQQLLSRQAVLAFLGRAVPEPLLAALPSSLPSEEATILLGMLSSWQLVHTCCTSPPEQLAVLRRFGLSTALAASLEAVVHPVCPWASELLWLALLALPVLRATTPAASSFERQERWSSKVQHMDPSTREQTLRRPLGGLDPALLQQTGWELSPTKPSPVRHSPSSALHRRHPRTAAGLQSPLQVMPPPADPRGSFQSPVMQARSGWPAAPQMAQPSPDRAALGLQSPIAVRESPLKRGAGVLEESPSKKMRPEAARPRAWKRKGEEQQ